MCPVLDIARYSEDGHHRYLLTREFGGSSTCVFVMLNPSTADADHDDPTIRRCIGFAKREGYGRLEIVNLFGFMATDPAELFASDDPVGNDNDAEIASALARAEVTVVAWGNHGAVDGGRLSVVLGLIADSGKPTKCFGVTAKAQPKHPLYLPSDAELVDFLSSNPNPLSGTLGSTQG
jgi:hypothetical protein